MLKRSLFLSFIILSAFTAILAQEETEPANASSITGTKLPAGAVRVLPAGVPAEIKSALDQMIESGEGKIIGGEREVLAWAGSGYKKSNAPNMIKQIENNLKTQGWEYEVGAKESGVTFFSVVRESPRRQAVMGFYVAETDALVVAWTEVLAPGSGSGSQLRNDDVEPSVKTPAVKNSGTSRTGGSIVGTWTNGATSMLGEKNQVTGAITSRSGSTFKYVFNSNGNFEFIGLMNSTMYGCTTSLFNDKRGRYEISGSQLTLIPNKNFWRKQNSCAPNSNSEQNYKLDRETFQFRTKTDEYGATLVCLANAKGEESCYRREGK